MAHLTIADLQHERSIPNHVDVLVIGAGMSGLYATWRLLDNDPNTDVLIFERSNRTGGRLDSDLIHFKGGATVKEEEGGMRFTFDTMDDLMSLFLILGIDDQIVPFPMNSGGNNRLYFRGHSFTNAQASSGDFAIWDALYNLDQAEQGINPKTIIDTVFNRILDVNPQFTERPDNRSPEFWQKFRLECQWNGTLMKDWTLWDLFTDMGYSNECITLLYRLLGFNGTFLSKMNAGVAYQLLEDFPSEPDFKTLENGFSTLPNALVEKVGKERIFLKTSLESIDKQNDDGSYELTYTSIDKDGNTFRSTITAGKLILGLPRLALEKLYVRSNAFNVLEKSQSEKLWDMLHSTTDQPLLKINLYYDKAWWGNSISGRPQVKFGPNFADLPTGSVYPFYAIDQETFAALEYEKWAQTTGSTIPADIQAKLDVADQRRYGLPAALTIYCDYLNINFWKGMQECGELFTSPMQEEYSGKQPETIFPASERVVEVATEFFKKIFNTHYVPRPTMTSARIWEGSTQFNVAASEQFGYGVHQWALHANDAEAMEFLTEPMTNLYTCGEAFSDYQGWVEGALRSTDLVLAKGFGLKPISEVYKVDNGKSSSEAIKESYAKQSAELIRKYIDPNFKGGEETELAEVQGAHMDELGDNYGLKLTYFDQ